MEGTAKLMAILKAQQELKFQKINLAKKLYAEATSNLGTKRELDRTAWGTVEAFCEDIDKLIEGVKVYGNDYALYQRINLVDTTGHVSTITALKALKELWKEELRMSYYIVDDGGKHNRHFFLIVQLVVEENPSGIELLCFIPKN